MSDLARIFIIIGAGFICVGLLLIGKVPGVGKLPGDLVIKRENFTLYFPIITCIIMSILLSVIFYFWRSKQ